MRFRTCGVSGALELFELAKRFVDIYMFLSFRRQALVAEQAGLTWLGNCHHFRHYSIGTAQSGQHSVFYGAPKTNPCSKTSGSKQCEQKQCHSNRARRRHPNLHSPRIPGGAYQCTYYVGQATVYKDFLSKAILEVRRCPFQLVDVWTYLDR